MDDDKDREIRPATHARAPERELEQELKRAPHDLDKKVDVGSDESMDASDPPSSSHPGQDDRPVPSSSFPE